MTHQTVGYIRVSSHGQNVARQLAGIEMDRVFTDMMTGRIKSRPQLEECLKYVREGDTLVVDSIDRLARNLRDLQEIIDELLKKGVTVRFIKENLTFNSNHDPMATLMLQMMGAFAEFERTMINCRQREGMEAAKREGRHVGRPSKINKAFREAVKEKLSNSQSIRSIAKEMKVSRTTIYKIKEGY